MCHIDGRADIKTADKHAKQRLLRAHRKNKPKGSIALVKVKWNAAYLASYLSMAWPQTIGRASNDVGRSVAP